MSAPWEDGLGRSRPARWWRAVIHWRPSVVVVVVVVLVVLIVGHGGLDHLARLRVDQHLVTLTVLEHLDLEGDGAVPVLNSGPDRLAAHLALGGGDRLGQGDLGTGDDRRLVGGTLTLAPGIGRAGEAERGRGHGAGEDGGDELVTVHEISPSCPIDEADCLIDRTENASAPLAGFWPDLYGFVMSGPANMSHGGEAGPGHHRWSRDTHGVRASEVEHSVEHSVEHLDGHGGFGGLGCVGMEARRVIDHPLEGNNQDLT